MASTAGRKKRTGPESRGRAAVRKTRKDPGDEIDKVKAAVEWYTTERATYQQLANKVEGLLREVLEQEDLEHLSVTSRDKSLGSYEKKAAEGKYKDPRTQIKDMAGVRVISYFETEAKKIADRIEQLFDWDREHSSDTSARLGVDRMGYRSRHYVCQFDKARCKMTEFSKFAGLEFEIQVSTVLQHAWAEMEHDRNYKFAGVLPEEIQRRFNVLAGVLELADREFDAISGEIDSYIEQVARKTQLGDLDIDVNTTSLREYMLTKFRLAIASGLEPAFGSGDHAASEIVEELLDFGISRLSELDQIVPDDLPERTDLLKRENFRGLLRGIMIVQDETRYFTNSWKGRWHEYGAGTDVMEEAYGVDVASRREWLANMWNENQE